MYTETAFGHWLKQRRRVWGYTQKNLAQQAGCAEVTLRKIEAGTLRPSAPLVAALAKALGAAEADVPAIIMTALNIHNRPAAALPLHEQPLRHNNLTAQLTPLIARDADVAALRSHLHEQGERLITLLGPPGVGKTRLAQAVAAEIWDHFENGACFVPLESIRHPELVAAAIAGALGLQPDGPSPPALQLRAYLEDKHLLLLLDNFEQVVEAASLVDTLLRRCPWLHVIVTSRQPLRLRGERQVAVLPLAAPPELVAAGPLTAEVVRDYPAVALFTYYAQAAYAEFTLTDANAALVAALCRRLDGIPLAIELMAARMKLLLPDELLTRLNGSWILSLDGLRSVSARQKSLYGAIAWSYDLLTPAEKSLIARLATFDGAFTLDMAKTLFSEQETSNASLSSYLLDGIGTLLDKSLLCRQTESRGTSRYILFAAVRAFVRGRLAELEGTA